MGFRVGNSLVGFDEVGFIFSSKTAYCKFQAHIAYGTLGSGMVTCNQPKLPGPSAVVRKLLILDASSKGRCDLQPSSANGTKCSWTGWDGEVDMWPCSRVEH